MKSMNEEQFNVILGLYSKKGYRIIKDPKTKDEIPPFLSSLNYQPDYILRSENINYVVDLSPSKNFDNENKLKKIIEQVEQNKAWEFILVVVDTESKTDKPVPDIKPKTGKPVPDIKPKTDKPAPDIKPKEDKPVADIKPKTGKPVADIKPKTGKPVPDIKPKDDKLVPDIKPKDDKLVPDIKPNEDKPAPDIEQKEEKGTIDFEPEDEKSGAKFESIAKGYFNLKLMLENKLFESHPEPVLLYGWALLESMIRELIEKEQTGIDIGFLLNEAVSDDIIDNSEISGLKNIYLLRNKLVRGEFGIVTENLQLEPLIKVVNKLYDDYFS